MRKIWIIVLLLLLVLFVTSREYFTTYEEALKDVGQVPGYISLEPKCPEGATLSTDKKQCSGGGVTTTPSCSSDTLEFVDGVCKPKPTTPSPTTTTPETVTPVSATTTATTSGTPPPPPPGVTNTTGGSSTTPSFTASTTTKIGQYIFGPAFSGKGEIAKGVDSADSSTSTQYPELLGGGVKPSPASSLDLPGAANMGATENSKFLPYSRVPGDMDLIPDPYRVSQTFSTSSYSSKTEPVPFLTDFSAFLK